MTPESPGSLDRLFRWLVARRWWIVAVYALLLPPGVWFALQVEQDNSLDRLIVQTDADYQENEAFEKVFGSGEFVILLAEAPDPFTPEVLRRVEEIEARLRRVKGIEPSSALDVYRRARGALRGTPEDAERFRAFATGTRLLRKQGLVGADFLSIPIGLQAPNAAETKERLEAIDAAIAGFEKDLGPLTALRKTGGPYINRYLDEDTSRASLRYMPIFAFLLLGLNLFLYRSWRALFAFVITIGAAVALTVGYVGATGGVITIVSPLIPMTILITCTATLVYIHSRFVECPEDEPPEEHQIFALSNKFVACTASIFAAAAGFGALTVSRIRPIRELGVWTAVGLMITWVVVFTLFPALQRILGTPTKHERRVAGAWFQHLVVGLPRFTYRWRYALIGSALLLCAAGVVALFGVPGIVAPMPLETDALAYMNPDTPLYADTQRLEQVISGLSVTEVWVKGGLGAVADPAVLLGLDRFQDSLERTEGVGSVAGPTTILRMMRYTSGEGDGFPEERADLEKAAADLEQLAATEPMLQSFVDAALSQTHISVISRGVDYEAFRRLEAEIRGRWEEAVRRDPALGALEMKTTGIAPLEAKISYYLVPTLVESFALTVAIIFAAFLLVFRNGAARLMAMIPSLFAILVMFAVMRVTGIGLNVATILIASTVLGASENDQIHFFYHFLERRKNGSVEEGLRHTLHIAGKAIGYATLINAGGFLAFAFADLPPMRQFGILSALAFSLSMLADFTALPAALWIVFRQKPDGDRSPEEGESL